MNNVWPRWFMVEYLAIFVQSMIFAKPESCCTQLQIIFTLQFKLYIINIFSHNYIAGLISLRLVYKLIWYRWVDLHTHTQENTYCKQCNDLMVIVHVTLVFLSVGRPSWDYLIRIWLDVRRNEVQPIMWLSSSSFTSSLTSKHICQPPSSLVGECRL